MGININIEKNPLLSSLVTLQNVTGKKGTIAILSNVLLETGNNCVTFTGTDLEVGIRITIPAEVRSAGTITLPSRKFLEIVRESTSQTIHLEEKENHWIKIDEGSSHYNLAGMDSKEFPDFPEYDEERVTEIPGELVVDLIEKTIFSVANEGESQFNLTGALLECEERNGINFLRMVSSDGHRLSLMERELPKEINLAINKKTLIPKKGLSEIKKIAESADTVSLSIEDKQAVVKTEDAILIIRLLNGDFPDYQGIIGIIEENNVINVDRIRLMNSMKRMNLFTEDRFNVVNIKVDNGKMTLFSQSADIGNARDEISITYTGDELSLYFNGKYFIETLQVLSADKVNLYISSEKSPCFIKSNDDAGFVSVIMPMKI